MYFIYLFFWLDAKQCKYYIRSNEYLFFFARKIPKRENDSKIPFKPHEFVGAKCFCFLKNNQSHFYPRKKCTTLSRVRNSVLCSMGECYGQQYASMVRRREKRCDIFIIVFRRTSLRGIKNKISTWKNNK